MALRARLLVVLLLLAGVVLLPRPDVSGAAPARVAAVRSCGHASGKDRKLLAVRANGVGCVRARTLMRTYLRTRGADCTANACVKRVSGFTCATNPDYANGVSNVVVACARKRRWVRALA